MSRNIFVIGATGYLGGVLARHFVEEGYEVTGLARREEAGAKLAADGITSVSGSLDDGMATVLAAASDADAVVYAAQVALDREPEVLERLCQALAGTGKTLIFTSGSGVFMKRTAGEWTSEAMAEDDPFEPVAFLSERVRTERIVRAAAETGVRAMVVRPPAI
ncbi:NAD-dependent epimerase/dehydratase family protein [Methylorubrum extorquens]